MILLLPKNHNPKNRLDFYFERSYVIALEIDGDGSCVGIFTFDPWGKEIDLADLGPVMQAGIEAFADRKYATVLTMEGA